VPVSATVLNVGGKATADELTAMIAVNAIPKQDRCQEAIERVNDVRLNIL
jgi:hypothetical protein